MISVHSNSSRESKPEILSRSRSLLDRFASTWPKRAYVKNQELGPFFEEGKEDFLEHLLPFREMPQYQRCSPELKSRVLSCGWLIYNAKTVQIETEIVSPTCMNVIRGDMPGLCDEISQRAVCETMVDEVYHVHLVEQASRLTRRRRRLENVSIPQFNLVRHMRRRQDGYAEPWRKRMVQFATAVVSEIFISNYLHLLSEDTEIQPFNRMTVAAHRHDEMAHSPLFRSLACMVFAELTEQERATFADLLPEPVLWFADRELDIWQTLLLQIGFPGAQKMIRECRSFGAADLKQLDYSSIVVLAEEVGILDSTTGRQSFRRQGLVS